MHVSNDGVARCGATVEPREEIVNRPSRQDTWWEINTSLTHNWRESKAELFELTKSTLAS
jgi:hypothetical protein